MAVRLPSAQAYAAQVAVEQRWLPFLAPALPLQIPEPLAMGTPSHGYPWNWSVYRWIPGEASNQANINSLFDFSRQLAAFLISLQRIEAASGPQPGLTNFHRGGSLSVYDDQARSAIAALGQSHQHQRCRTRLERSCLALAGSGRQFGYTGTSPREPAAGTAAALRQSSTLANSLSATLHAISPSPGLCYEATTARPFARRSRWTPQHGKEVEAGHSGRL